MFIRTLMIRVVVGRYAVGTEMVPAKVDEFAAYLDGCQIEKVLEARDFNRGQGTMQPDEASLEHIVGLHPSGEVRPAAEHFSS